MMTQLALAATPEMKGGGSPRRRTHRANWSFVIALSIALLLTVEPLSARAAGTWSATGSMNTAREQHTATLLPTGKVLVAGGVNSAVFLASAELYDPATGSWSSTGSMSTARVSNTATLLPTGKVLVAGGVNSTGYLASAELYDPATGSWSSTGSMTTVHGEAHTATLLPSGKVLVAGGYNGSYLASAELYDPATGSWSSTGSMSTARALHTATLLLTGEVLVAGGFDGSGYVASAELYDPATGSWSSTGSMSTARGYQRATLLPTGEVLVAGGINTLFLASAELYSPGTGSWSATGSMSTARYLHTLTLLPSGKVLVAGGYSTGFLASAELYDAATGSWSSTGSMSTARTAHTATLLPSGKALVAGGFDGSGDLVSAELYQETPTPATLTLEPPTATNTVGATHCVTATVKDAATNPVPGVTVRFSVPTAVTTHASPASGSAPTDANGQAGFCFIATLPGTDTIHAYADTDNSNTQDPGEPFGDATKTWTAPTSTQFCEVTIKDIGRIVANNSDPAKFTGHAKVMADMSVQGQQSYEDLGPVQPLKVDSIELTATTCSSDHTTATILGRTTINGAGSHTFRIDVTDGKSVASDTYGITLDTGYVSGQHQLTKGKVTIQ